MKLSIVIPVFNEAKTLPLIIERVLQAPIPAGLEREVVLIDDGSSDGTAEVIKHLPGGLLVATHKHNRGKGAAVITGLHQATGDIVLIQDADLEYDPNDYSRLLAPVLDGRAEVVYGSRFAGNNTRLVTGFWHRLVNHFLTWLSNMLSNLTLTDMETCYKVFNREVVDEIKGKLISRRFGIEPEITARVKHRAIYEVPISYHGRKFSEGKKINWRDGVAAMWWIVRFNLWPY
jgi:glycosyltransferase involved in cell wall biosynthesis